MLYLFNKLLDVHKSEKHSGYCVSAEFENSAQPLGQSILLKFSLETRLESESIEPLTNFLAFLIQKL